MSSGISQSSYFAFTAAYGMLMGAFMAVSGIALSAAQIQPIFEIAEPFLKTEPETADGKTENLGFVCNVADGLTVALSSGDAGFCSVAKEGRTYYGAPAGATVTVTAESESICVLDAKGNALVLTPAEGGFTFTMPADCGVTVQQKHIHTYGAPAWSWNGYESAEATFTCTEDASHTLTLPAEITTQSSGYAVVYTASVELDGAAYTDTRTVYLEPAGGWMRPPRPLGPPEPGNAAKKKLNKTLNRRSAKLRSACCDPGPGINPGRW